MCAHTILTPSLLDILDFPIWILLNVTSENWRSPAEYGAWAGDWLELSFED